MKRFTCTEDAHEYALTISRDERDHIWYNYQALKTQIAGLIKILPKLDTLERRRRADNLLKASTQAMFLRECVEEFDRLDKISSEAVHQLVAVAA